MARRADMQKKEQMERSQLLKMLDRGIDDMEAGHELPIEEAFRKISELRVVRRSARV